ncbi:MAG: uncharacterized protein KVP18_001549 [Porospora cf. gigantea A]|uniref:uncharacterized protein n=1 Tax=Porospora cf. gigantea A TaxID=2853593 RepID=UPI00355989CF|nr:MAG: hypothetical protein KVP18_001549 [Porospora cf. gigantea A]
MERRVIVLPSNADPATRNIPLRGKIVATATLTGVWTFLTLVAIIVEGGVLSFDVNPMLGVSADTLVSIGGLSRSHVVAGEWYRVFWSHMLHAGLLHWLFNCIAWFPVGLILEPDWGSFRFLWVYSASALTGNLLSATLDARNVSVGASGGILGCFSGLAVYILEFRRSIPFHKIWVGSVFFMILLTIATGFMPYVDNYAHLGGSAGGVLASLSTLSTWGVQQWRTHPLPDVTKVQVFDVNSRARRLSIRKSNSPYDVDIFEKGRGIWLVRMVSFLLLVWSWGVMAYYLGYCDSCYTPPGQLYEIIKSRLSAMSSSDEFLSR